MRALSSFLVAVFHRIQAKWAQHRAKREVQRTKESPPV